MSCNARPEGPIVNITLCYSCSIPHELWQDGRACWGGIRTRALPMCPAAGDGMGQVERPMGKPPWHGDDDSWWQLMTTTCKSQMVLAGGSHPSLALQMPACPLAGQGCFVGQVCLEKGGPGLPGIVRPRSLTLNIFLAWVYKGKNGSDLNIDALHVNIRKSIKCMQLGMCLSLS